jgi:hypothetical protein
MRTLDELSAQVGVLRGEARTPLGASTTPGDASAHFVITQPGAYVLTADLIETSERAGIRIALTQPGAVSLDLNGFSLISQANTLGLHGIVSTGSATVVNVRHGRLRGWTGCGVRLSGPGVLRDLVIEDCTEGGIQILTTQGPGAPAPILVERCLVRAVGGAGIDLASPASLVRDCVVTEVDRSPFGQNARGIQAALVVQCRVGDINADLNATSLASGIEARELVADSAVYDLTSTGPTLGLAAPVVLASTYTAAASLPPPNGQGNAPQLGIRAQLAYRAEVISLRADTTGEVSGLRAALARECTVASVTNQGLAVPTGLAPHLVATEATGTATTSALHARGNTVRDIAGRGLHSTGPSFVLRNRITDCTRTSLEAGGLLSANTVSGPAGQTGPVLRASGYVRDHTVQRTGSGLGLELTAGLAVRNTAAGGTFPLSFAPGTRYAPTYAGTAPFHPLANAEL